MKIYYSFARYVCCSLLGTFTLSVSLSLSNSFLLNYASDHYPYVKVPSYNNRIKTSIISRKNTLRDIRIMASDFRRRHHHMIYIYAWMTFRLSFDQICFNSHLCQLFTAFFLFLTVTWVIDSWSDGQTFLTRKLLEYTRMHSVWAMHIKIH